MAKEKKSFVLYTDLMNKVDHLTVDELGKLFWHMLEYVNDKDPVLEDRVLISVWKHIEAQLNSDLEKYKARCQKNKKNAIKRWGKDDAIACDRMQSDAIAYNRMQSDANACEWMRSDGDTDTDTDTDTDSNSNKKKKEPPLTPPKKKSAPIDWAALLKWFNDSTDRSFRTVSDKTKRQVQKIASTYGDEWKELLKQAVTNAQSDEYMGGDGRKYLTLEYITRPDQFEKWASIPPPTSAHRVNATADDCPARKKAEAFKNAPYLPR